MTDGRLGMDDEYTGTPFGAGLDASLPTGAKSL